MRKLNLYQLAEKAIGISKTVGEFLGEAAQVCLELQGHQSGVQINILGVYTESVSLVWDKKLDKETFLSWKDVNEATEYGATAISLLILLHFEGYNFVGRLPQISIADYVLKKESLDRKTSTDETFVEISGIYKKSLTNTLNIRISQKKRQLRKKQTANLNVLIAVVEFSKPKAKVVKL